MKKIKTCAFFEIFKSNSLGEVIQFEDISTIKFSASQALVFSEIVGASYIGYGNIPFSYHGLNKIFQSALRGEMVTGLFDRGIEYWTPRGLEAKYPGILEGSKYVIPLEFESEQEFQKKVAWLRASLKSISDVMVFRIDNSKKGGGLENLLEYVFGLIFRANGFIVESQAPLSHQKGTPDLIAIKSSQIAFLLRKLEVPKIFGFTSEFSMLESSFNSETQSQTPSSNVIEFDDVNFVCEAKVDNIEVESRLKKYLSTGFFDYACQLKPDFEDKLHKDFYSFGFLNDWKISHNFNVQMDPQHTVTSKAEYLNWYQEVIALYLITNFSSLKINEYTRGEYLKNPIKWLLSEEKYGFLEENIGELKNGAV